jgi:hypothetical protein
LVPIVVTLVGIVTDASDVQSKKALSSIVLTLSGMVTDVSDVHPENAWVFIVVTELGIVTDVSAVHDSNACVPITVTLLGITTDVNSVHESKALLAILVVLLVKVMEHGDDVHRLQQPLPSLLLQTRTVHVVLVGRAPTATDLVTLSFQLVIQGNGSFKNAEASMIIIMMIVII